MNPPDEISSNDSRVEITEPLKIPAVRVDSISQTPRGSILKDSPIDPQGPVAEVASKGVSQIQLTTRFAYTRTYGTWILAAVTIALTCFMIYYAYTSSKRRGTWSVNPQSTRGRSLLVPALSRAHNLLKVFDKHRID
jgi:hypothetical protein